MAALYGNISKNEGQTWSSWAENIGYQSPESVDENDEDDEANDLKKKEGDALQLKKEDMRLFGFCPAWDDFFLVVCELCGLIVKPQALKSHLGCVLYSNVTDE
ncbi:ataxin-7-like protein 1 [Limulus polyphemus]|uniref:Ataxin-7-like protein 1 n=1 Tax=Limulus polyphemus TaxID=6850 RepID=A0ABM1THJ0_LIMPO|nr:ataxin-7-like protein 1 [Limulus polyphemus]